MLAVVLYLRLLAVTALTIHLEKDTDALIGARRFMFKNHLKDGNALSVGLYMPLILRIALDA